MSTLDTLHTSAEVDTTPEYEAICASEDLAHIGAIQGLGFLLVGHVRSETLVQLSRNTTTLLGGELAGQAPDVLLGTRMRSLVGSSWAQGLRLTAGQPEPKLVPLIDSPHIGNDAWMCRAHRSSDFLVMEFLPAGGAPVSYGDLDLRTSVAALTEPDSVEEVVETAASVFRNLTTFDRVMIYRFLPDWSGEVIAESTADGFPILYRGNRFPAGDIPAQARALYADMGVRLIADTELGSAAMTPPQPTGHTEPLDMSRCLIRAVSRAHIEYLGNMGIRQSMSLALHVNERLWGLVSCHQEAAKPLKLKTFASVIGAAERLAMLVESRLAEQLDADDQTHRDAIQDAIHRTLTTARAIGYDQELLTSLLDKVRRERGYSCVGILVNEWSVTVGPQDKDEQSTGTAAAIAELCRQSHLRHHRAMLETRDVRNDYGALDLDDTTMGLLAYRPAEFQRVTVFVGLPETIETVSWAGNPDIVRKQEVDGQVVIGPRSSFAQWQRDERGRSRFWNDSDRKTLFQLADALRVWVTSAERSQ